MSVSNYFFNRTLSILIEDNFLLSARTEVFQKNVFQGPEAGQHSPGLRRPRPHRRLRHVQAPDLPRPHRRHLLRDARLHGAGDHQGPEVQSVRGLVVLWRPPVRDAHRAVALQRPRRGGPLLVHLQRASSLPSLSLY